MGSMANRKSTQLLDSATAEKGTKPVSLGALEKTQNKPVLFLPQRKTKNFFTEDSRLYITPQELKQLQNGVRINRQRRPWDGVAARCVNIDQHCQPQPKAALRREIMRHCKKGKESISGVATQLQATWRKLSLPKLWHVSIVMAIFFGMFLMTMLYRYLGPGAMARSNNLVLSENGDAAEVTPLTAGLKSNSEIDREVADKITQQFMARIGQNDQSELEKEIRTMVAGYPIEKMLPEILEKDKIVAAFLIGIAKKESNWGRRIPVLDGQDCFNYWGYRGQRKMMGSGGHTCFNSRKDAVDSVAKRLDWLVSNNKLNTPEKMIIWKCGSTCAGHSNYSVQKWISDVNMYFEKLND